MQRKIALGAWFCWLLTSAVVLGGPKAGTVDPKVFVSQLGDDSFAVREAAAKHLQELGKAAEAALRGATTDSDPEVRRQVKILLDRLDRSELELALAAFLRDGDEKHMEQLPAWKRFSQLAGNDSAARALFIDVCTSESALVTALDTDPRAAADQFAARCQQLQLALFSPNSPAMNFTVGNTAALLFAATDGRLQLTAQVLYPLRNLLYQPHIRAGFETNAPARRLLAAFLESRDDLASQQQNIQLAMNLDLTESLGWIVKLATAKETTPLLRATALAGVGKMGNEAHIAALQPFLADTTALAQVSVGGQLVHTEVRDVALAVIVCLSGQPVEDYGFPFLATLPPGTPDARQRIFTAPAFLGFADAASRAAAFQRWKDRPDHERKK